MTDIQLKVQKPLKDLVYLELKHKILTGEIVSQTRLMEIDLSEKMNVSRTPIREAIKRLADDGLVKVEPRRGAYVANISIKDMLDVFEVREDMEGFVAKLAAQRITEDEKEELRAIAEEYEAAGAEAISCLTEPKWFLGSDRIFQEIRQAVGTPMLRKDFTVSAYQIYQARVMGANAVLLICAILDERELETYLALSRELGLAALTETHDEAEIEKAVKCGAKIIGVNNRNLKDFSVNIANAERLREKVPADCLFVAESGVSGPEDAERIRRSGADAALVGEALMRAKDKKAMLNAMRAGRTE